MPTAAATSKKRTLPRLAAIALTLAGALAFFLMAHTTSAHAAPPATSRVSSADRLAPPDDPRVMQGSVISTVQSIVNYVINASVFFPARTFQEAIEKATRNIFSDQLDQFREPLEQVVGVYAFQNGAVFGSLAIPGEVNAIGARLTEAAVPIWALGLVLIGLSVLTRNAVGMGHGTVEVAAELARWLFIALASGNAIAIVNLVHTGFGALTYAIASEGGTVTSADFVAAFIPSDASIGAWPILMLVIGCVLGLIVILVLAATYIARYVVLLAITGLAPICIACEGIPFTRFVFRDWLSMFLRLEFLQIINIAVLIVFKALALGAAGSGLAQALLRLAIMIGLASAIIGINLSIFRQVFGVAIDVVAQLRQAAEQMVRVVGLAIGAAVTGGAAVPALAGAAGSSISSATATSTPSLPGGEAAASGRAAWAMSGAVGGLPGAFLRGYGDGAAAGSEYTRQRASAARAHEVQRAAELRRAEALAREMGATNSDDIEAIARSMTEPKAGHTPEQMTRAHRDNAPALREMAQTYGSPARAAAVGGHRSFADLAIAMAHERLGEGAPALSEESRIAGRGPARPESEPGDTSARATAATPMPGVRPATGASPSSAPSHSAPDTRPMLDSPASLSAASDVTPTTGSTSSPGMRTHSDRPSAEAAQSGVAHVGQPSAAPAGVGSPATQDDARLYADRAPTGTSSTAPSPGMPGPEGSIPLAWGDSATRATAPVQPAAPLGAAGSTAPSSASDGLHVADASPTSHGHASAAPLRVADIAPPPASIGAQSTGAAAASSPQASPPVIVGEASPRSTDVPIAHEPLSGTQSRVASGAPLSPAGVERPLDAASAWVTPIEPSQAMPEARSDLASAAADQRAIRAAEPHPEPPAALTGGDGLPVERTPFSSPQNAPPVADALSSTGNAAQPFGIAPGLPPVSDAGASVPSGAVAPLAQPPLHADAPARADVASHGAPSSMGPVTDDVAPAVNIDSPEAARPTDQFPMPSAFDAPAQTPPTREAPAMPSTPAPSDPPPPRDAPLADWAAHVPPAPIRDWIHAPPRFGAPGEESLLPFDFGVGAMLARVTDSSPTHAPLWAQTAYSLRMAYGEGYVTHLLQEAQSARWSERDLMMRVERHVEATPSPRAVSLFWKPGGRAAAPGERGKGKP